MTALKHKSKLNVVSRQIVVLWPKEICFLYVDGPYWHHLDAEHGGMPQKQGTPCMLNVSNPTGEGKICNQRVRLLCFVSFIDNLPVNRR